MRRILSWLTLIEEVKTGRGPSYHPSPLVRSFVPSFVRFLPPIFVWRRGIDNIFYFCRTEIRFHNNNKRVWTLSLIAEAEEVSISPLIREERQRARERERQ